MSDSDKIVLGLDDITEILDPEINVHEFLDKIFKLSNYLCEKKDSSLVHNKQTMKVANIGIKNSRINVIDYERNKKPNEKNRDAISVMFKSPYKQRVAGITIRRFHDGKEVMYSVSANFRVRIGITSVNMPVNFEEFFEILDNQKLLQDTVLFLESATLQYESEKQEIIYSCEEDEMWANIQEYIERYFNTSDPNAIFVKSAASKIIILTSNYLLGKISSSDLSNGIGQLSSVLQTLGINAKNVSAEFINYLLNKNIPFEHRIDFVTENNFTSNTFPSLTELMASKQIVLDSINPESFRP